MDTIHAWTIHKNTIHTIKRFFFCMQKHFKNLYLNACNLLTLFHNTSQQIVHSQTMQKEWSKQITGSIPVFPRLMFLAFSSRASRSPSWWPWSRSSRFFWTKQIKKKCLNFAKINKNIKYKIQQKINIKKLFKYFFKSQGSSDEMYSIAN